MVEKDESINYQFTKAGHDLAIRALAGVTQLDFTRAVTSTDNHFADTEADTLAITELANIKQTIDLKEVDAVDDDPSFVKVPVVINKAEMEEDYALLTIGLYCKPKDGDEVLYSVCAMQDPIYMHKSSNNSTYSIDLNTLVGSAANVVIKVDPAGMVTHADFDAMMKRVAFIDKANTFTEQQTLAGGAVDGKGNAIANTKDVSDGDATTLKSAKEYADTKVSGKADDSKVAHLSGANNFDTTPTVNNNPLLLASSLPSDLARTGQDTNFTAGLQKSGIDVATTGDVTTAISTATANAVGIDPNTSQITNTTVKANAGQILIGGQPAISLVQSADDATALTDSSNDAILHFTVEGD